MKLTDIEDIIDRTQGNLLLHWKTRLGPTGTALIGLSSLYSLFAVIALVSFAIESYYHNHPGFGSTLLLFACLIISSAAYQHVTGKKKVTNSLNVLFLGVLCLILLYTGGSGGTGPLWYYVFPLFALFAQRLWAGTFSVLLLFIITLLLFWHPPAGFHQSLFSREFKEQFLAVYVGVSVMAFFYAFLRTSAEMDMDSVNRNLADLANTDELTQLPNRRHMKEILHQEIERTRRNNGKFSLIILDLDKFKEINDAYGHDCGDAVLRSTRGIFHSVLRGQDTCGRWGGEEFIILMPRTDLRGARLVAERLRIAFEKKRINFRGNDCSVTASLGICEFKNDSDLEACLRQADQNLYLAKASGRNRVVAK